MRAGERNGVDYDFVSEEEFQRLVDAGEFLEHAGVHSKRYGTRITTVLEAVQAGKTVILAIDVQGRALIQDAGNPRLSGVGITSIFVHVGIEESRRRLNARGDMTAEQIEARMKIAIEELARMNEFDFRVENRSGQIEMAYTVLESTLGL